MPLPLVDGFWLGRVGREPVNIVDPELSGFGRTWMHVNCIMEGPQAPVCASLTRAGAMSGDRVNPGDWWETQVLAGGIWLCGPKDGAQALVAVEKRLVPTNQQRSLLGELVTMTSWKSTLLGVEVTPGKYHRPWTNILGLGFGWFWASGRGPVWMGTHMGDDSGPPPSDAAMAVTGGAFPLMPNLPPQLLPGNPALTCFAYEPGVTLHLCKIGGGRQFGTGVWPLKAELS